MGVLYNKNKEAILYFDDNNSGYVYADTEHKLSVAYFNDSSVYENYNDAAWGERQLAKISLFDRKAESFGNECYLSDSSVYKVSHPFDETLGYYKGDFYGAAAASAIAFLIADTTGSFPDHATDGNNSGSEVSSDSSGCLGYFFIGIFKLLKLPFKLLYKLIILLFKGIAIGATLYTEKIALIVPLPVLAVFYFNTFVESDGPMVIVICLLLLIPFIGMYLILKKKPVSRKIQIIYSLFGSVLPGVLFILAWILRVEVLSVSMFFFMIGTWIVFYSHKILIPFIKNKKNLK